MKAGKRQQDDANAPQSLLVATTTCGNLPDAQRLAAQIVDQRAAACVQITTGVTSVYRWQGAVQTEQEHLLTIKTTPGQWRALENVIAAYHPYELPELLAVETAACTDAYRRWVCEQISASE